VYSKIITLWKNKKRQGIIYLFLPAQNQAIDQKSDINLYKYI